MTPSLEAIPGWFPEIDRYLFDWLLADQNRRGVDGDLVEIGTYYGKSAIVIGRYLRPQQRLTVIDLYEGSAADDANEDENASYYPGLSKAAFEANYLQFHAELPTVVQGLSSEILEHVEPATVRFHHVDGSHLYEHVRGDVLAAKALVQPDGVVVFDDYRTPHTPGVSAAVWEAVLNLGFKPVALTPQKLYGTWGDADSLRDRLLAELRGQDVWMHEIQEVRGADLIRLFPKPKPKTRVYKARRRIARKARAVVARLAPR